MIFVHYLRAIFESFYSKKLYQDVALTWQGRGFLYLAFLTFFAASATGLALYSYLQQVSNQYYARIIHESVLGDGEVPEVEKINRLFELVSSIPPLSLEGGELVVAGNSTQTVVDPFNPASTIIDIDSTLSADAIKPIAPISLTKDAFIVQYDGNDTVFYYDETAFSDHSWSQIFDVIGAFPRLKIENGVATMDATSPLTIYDTADRPLFYFDVRDGAYLDEVTIEDAPKIVFLRKEMHFFTEGDTPAAVVAYDAITKEKIIDAIEASLHHVTGYLKFLLFIVVVFIALGFFLFCMAIISLLAVVAQAIAKHKRLYHLHYKDCQRLAAVAFTPALIAKALLPFFPLANVVYFLMTLAYIYYAVMANQQLNEGE